jgi:hypothetical protein
MTVLLILTSAMLAVSGAVKLRTTSRVGLGLAPLALLEIAVAVLLTISAVPGAPGARQVRWLVPTAVALLLTSSVQHGLRLGAYRSRRSETEGGRLASYVRYSEARGEQGSRGPG